MNGTVTSRNFVANWGYQDHESLRKVGHEAPHPHPKALYILFLFPFLLHAPQISVWSDIITVLVQLPDLDKIDLDNRTRLECDLCWYMANPLIMIYLLTAFGLTPGGSNTVHIYTQTIHRRTHKKTMHGATQNSRLNNSFLVARVTRGAPLCTFTTARSCRIIGGLGSESAHAGTYRNWCVFFEVHKLGSWSGDRFTFVLNNNNNKLQMDCRPVAVVLMHVPECEIRI
jgi:hypothetical protein